MISSFRCAYAVTFPSLQGEREDSDALLWEPYDVIIGSDITHGDDHAEPVFNTILYFLKKDGIALIAKYALVHMFLSQKIQGSIIVSLCVCSLYFCCQYIHVVR